MHVLQELEFGVGAMRMTLTLQEWVALLAAQPLPPHSVLHRLYVSPVKASAMASSCATFQHFHLPSINCSALGGPPTQ